MGISFKSTNTIQYLTDLKQQITYRNIKFVKFTNSLCNPFKLPYNEQTNWNLKHRYQEHIRYIKQNDPKSVYALHILNNNHECGRINITMNLLTQITKTSLLIPYEEFCIYSHCHHKELMPEQYTSENNPVYQLNFDPHNTSPPATNTDQHSDTTVS